MRTTHCLRSLFIVDACQHSGVYDADAGDRVWTPTGVKKPVKVRNSKDRYRVQLETVIDDEDDLEQAIVDLIMASVKPVKTSLAEARKRLKKCHTILVGTSTLVSFRSFVSKRSNLWQAPTKAQKEAVDFLRMENVTYAPHPSVPEGVLIGFEQDPEFTGLISAPHFFPYPVGLALRQPQDLVGVRVSV